MKCDCNIIHGTLVCTHCGAGGHNNKCHIKRYDMSKTLLLEEFINIRCWYHATMRFLGMVNTIEAKKLYDDGMKIIEYLGEDI
jgi:hypothetical protein